MQKAAATFMLYSMSSAMRMQSKHSVETCEYSETFLRQFVGEAYTPEVLACFTSELGDEGDMAAYDAME